MTAERKSARDAENFSEIRERRSVTIRIGSLIDKLGVKPGQKIAVLGVESTEFLTDLEARVPEYSRGKRLNGADLIFFSAEAMADLAQLSSLARAIQKNGAIWVAYPKAKNTSAKLT